MLHALVRTCLFAGCAVSLSLPAAAQEIVHAFTGTVSAVDPAANTITVFRDNGTKGVFRDASGNQRIAFDKRIQEGTTSAQAFKQSGAYAIVFYYGDTDQPSIVALKNLGSGPFDSTVGTVSRFEGHDHTLQVKDKSGTEHTFRITPKTVEESSMGALDGSKFEIQKGEQVRIVSTKGQDSTALFVREM